MTQDKEELLSAPSAEEQLEESKQDGAETQTAPRFQKVKISLSPLAFIVVLLGVIIGSTTGAAVGIYALDSAAKRNVNSGEIIISNSAGDMSWVTPAAAKAAPSTVAIIASSDFTTTSGSGFIVDPAGHVATSAHVVNHDGIDPESMVIQLKTWDGDIYPATILGMDLDTDVAVLKIEGDYLEGELRPITWGDSDKVSTGDPVIALGAPFDLLNTVTSGIVSNPDRVIQLTSQRAEQKASEQMQFFGEEVPVEDALNIRVIQSDVAVNPGNSGGPLVNDKGTVIGLIAAIAGGEYSSGLSFSVQGNNVRRIVTDIINTGSARNGLLGVIVGSSFPSWVDESAKASFLSGAEIVEVAQGSAAQEAGLQEGDIVLQADDTRIFSTVGLSSYIGSLPPESKVSIRFMRNGQEMTTVAILGQRVVP